MIDIERYIGAFKALPAGADWAEINADTQDEYSVFFKDGKQSGSEFYTKTVYYLQVSAGGKKGLVYTEKNDEDPKTLIRDALECAEYAEGISCPPLGKDASVAINEPDTESCEDVGAFGLALNGEAGREGGSSRLTECTVRRTTQARRVANSLGLDSSYGYTYYFVTLRMEQKNSSGEFITAIIKRSAASLKKLDPKELVSQGVKKVNIGGTLGGTLDRAKLAKSVNDCVLSADVTCNILYTAWQVFTGERVSSGTSVYKNIGVEVGPSFLNIIDAPNHPDWGFQAAIDSEGVINREKYVVENGVLANPMYTMQSAYDASRPPTGNAGRAALLSGGIPVKIVTIPGIFYIKPGTSMQESLVEQMGTGVFLTYSLDVFHTINIASGDFSIPCGGIIYNNGKAVGTIDKVSIVGNIRDLFMNIQAVGSDLQFDEFDYKNYSFGGPSLLVKGVTFSGFN